MLKLYMCLTKLLIIFWQGSVLFYKTFSRFLRYRRWTGLWVIGWWSDVTWLEYETLHRSQPVRHCHACCQGSPTGAWAVLVRRTAARWQRWFDIRNRNSYLSGYLFLSDRLRLCTSTFFFTHLDLILFFFSIYLSI